VAQPIPKSSLSTRFSGNAEPCIQPQHLPIFLKREPSLLSLPIQKKHTTHLRFQAPAAFMPDELKEGTAAGFLIAANQEGTRDQHTSINLKKVFARNYF
jgi:hypothetical protein